MGVEYEEYSRSTACGVKISSEIRMLLRVNVQRSRKCILSFFGVKKLMHRVLRSRMKRGIDLDERSIAERITEKVCLKELVIYAADTGESRMNGSLENARRMNENKSIMGK